MVTVRQQQYLSQLYSNRFSPKQQKDKLKLWKVLVESFIQLRIHPNSAVLDIGGGYCEFINQVKAEKKYLIDLNPDANHFADPDVNVMNVDILDKEQQKNVPTDFFDYIFVSNFFEHLRTTEELIEVLGFCFERLRPGGSLLVIQPNFKYSIKEYYDFIDHYLPITHLSLAEVLKAIDFEIEEMIPRFLPFSTKGRPSSPLLLQIYLKLPFAWNILGAQMFVKATRPR